MESSIPESSRGSDPLAFNDKLGILYRFPKKDVESMVFSGSEATQAAPPQNAKVIPTGTEISIRIREKIDSNDVTPGQKFSAEVTEPLPTFRVESRFRRSPPRSC